MLDEEGGGDLVTFMEDQDGPTRLKVHQQAVSIAKRMLEEDPDLDVEVIRQQYKKEREEAKKQQFENWKNKKQSRKTAKLEKKKDRKLKRQEESETD